MQSYLPTVPVSQLAAIAQLYCTPNGVPALDRIVDAIEPQPFLLSQRLCTSTPWDNPPCCALGALLLSAGMRATQILPLSNEPGAWPADVLALMRVRYGLVVSNLTKIADANDSAPAALRKQYVLATCAKLPGMSDRYPALVRRLLGGPRA